MDSKKVIGGMLAATAIGVAIGMLLAPRSGSKTKGMLIKGSRNLANGLMETMDESVQHLKDGFGNSVDALVKNGRELIGSGDKASK